MKTEGDKERNSEEGRSEIVKTEGDKERDSEEGRSEIVKTEGDKVILQKEEER